ncbi:hypothetical protein ACIGGE_11905 [Qipengyuania sp. NPDC077410]|uniref:hypothetical protein n=1 Tax=Qipengyuania sp. NPDC077410 TaxID=3364496 RepID=UPI0037C7AEEB
MSLKNLVTRVVGLSFAFAPVLALTAPDAASAKQKKLPKQVRAVLAMTPEDHQAKVTLEDDDMEMTAKLHTLQSYQEKHGLLGIVWSDIFLRAFVDKKTGHTDYQVYFTFRGTSETWPRLNQVNYDSPSGLQNSNLDRIASDVDCTASRYTGCTFTEVVAFDAPEDLLWEVAKRYRADQSPPAAWRFRFKGQSGKNVDEGLLAAEISGLLMAVAQYKAQRGIGPVASDESEPTSEVGEPAENTTEGETTEAEL